ncbi:hypothetical protein [Christiangramia sp. SM2212]|uniref:Outer membrane protein beta-barrel domain-containing protein n=1 Tax=Christiangramia sediminicola TaxID=3073267 RepID=A0ABU1ESP6_9FLAO|nr:hypothetical protein [Christiangramia sp. SM2212]MDR5591417.1 hypothetical protein [Christiangramia sp. SM2212]
MKEKKNIDRIFQEKFKDFEMEPREKAWENISARLDKKDKKGPLIIPLWFKIGGVAAVLAIILASLLFTNVQNPTNGEPSVVFDEPENSTDKEDSIKNSSNEVSGDKNNSDQIASENEIKENSESDKMNSSSNNNSRANTAIAAENTANKSNNNPNTIKRNTVNPENSKKKTNAIVSNELSDKKAIENDTDSPEIINDSDQSGKTAIASQTDSEKAAKDTIPQESILKEENALAEVEKEKNRGEEEETEIAEADTKKLRLSTFAAPVMYKNLGSGNELSNQLASNSTSSEVTLSYGVKIAYKISNKLKIRTGISKIDINKNTQDILYSPSAMSAGFENISPVEDNIEIRSNNNTPSPSGTGPAPLPNFGGENNNNSLTNSIATPGELNQQFGYIEVPVEIEYALIDKKFGLNIIGGGSSLFLDNNRVQLVSGEMKTDLGEATNINSTSFSTNIGVGMDYKLTDKFSISVEPIFKYQINTFDRVNNVQPVNFGVYSGLSFRF